LLCDAATPQLGCFTVTEAGDFPGSARKAEAAPCVVVLVRVVHEAESVVHERPLNSFAVASARG